MWISYFNITKHSLNSPKVSRKYTTCYSPAVALGRDGPAPGLDSVGELALMRER